MNDFNFTVSEFSFSYHRKFSQGYFLEVKKRKKQGLTLILSGELEITINGKTTSAKAGDIIIQHAGDTYQLNARRECGVEYIVISFLTTHPNLLKEHLADILFSTKNKNHYQRAFEQISRTFNSYDDICRLPFLRASVQQIICDILRERYSDGFLISNNPVERAKQYIQMHFTQELNTDEIANAVGYSSSHLRALFKKTVHQTPVNYINNLRIERAKEMLCLDMFTLTEIATACGFQNVYYFSTTFKKHTGISPGKYKSLSD